jgi:hypothetical protein
MTMKDENNTEDQGKVVETRKKHPDDVGSLSVEDHVKIFDPNTEEVYVSKR